MSALSSDPTAFDDDPFAPPAAAISGAALSISDAAAKRIAEMIADEKDPALRLRITVSGGGCSGFQYGFSFDKEATPDDILFEKNGTQVVTDMQSLRFLGGSTVDYVDDLVGAFFKIDNPNAQSSCGCGTSFSM